jgi:hypothetical protein
MMFRFALYLAAAAAQEADTSMFMFMFFKLPGGTKYETMQQTRMAKIV